jgi:hypothetical protein
LPLQVEDTKADPVLDLHLFFTQSCPSIRSMTSSTVRLLCQRTKYVCWFRQTPRESSLIKMSKYVITLLAVVSLVAVPSVAAQTPSAMRSGHAAVLYPIPSAPSSTGANAARAAAAYLATLSPATLAATDGPKLHAEASGPGTFTFVLSTEINGKTVVIGTGSKTVGSAEAIAIKVTFTKAGKATLLGTKGKLHITVEAIFKPRHGRTKKVEKTVTLK